MPLRDAVYGEAVRRGVPEQVAQDFMRFQQLADKHTAARLHNDFVAVYEQAGNRIEQRVLESISAIAQGYGADALEVEILLTIVYAGMVAETNKEHTKLKKRVKRLGMHQGLLENMTAEDAAVFIEEGAGAISTTNARDVGSRAASGLAREGRTSWPASKPSLRRDRPGSRKDVRSL